MPTKSSLSALLRSHARAVLSASSQDEFFLALSAGQQEVQSLLPVASHTPYRQKWLAREVEAAFSTAAGNQRLRRAMEALLLPATAVTMPAEQSDSLPEFLWTFCLPVRLTFKTEQLDRITVFHGAYVPIEELLLSLEQSGVVSDKAILGGYTSLYRREDLYAYGPLAIAQSFVTAEVDEDFEPPHPLPVIMDGGLPGNVTVTSLILMSARLPLGEKVLFRSRLLKKETRQVLETTLLSRLRAEGIDVEKVEADQLTHLTEMYFHSGGPLARELEAHLETLKRAFGSSIEVVGRVPAPGYFEVNVIDEGGQEHLGIAAFPTLEPPEVLRSVLERLCERTSTRFKTVTTSTTIQPSTQLH